MTDRLGSHRSGEAHLPPKATVYDVAKLAGVSIATVSFAFRKPARVRPETIERVMHAAESLGYIPSASARSLARGRTGAIGLYAFDYLLDAQEASATGEAVSRGARLFPLYADEVQRGVQLECRRRGYALMLGGNRGVPHVANVIDIAGRVDGMISFAGALSHDTLARVAAQVPTVELGGEVRAEGSRTVFVDNRSAMVELTNHLIDHHGYRDFAYIGELGTPEFRQRFDGFSAALTAADLSVPEIFRGHPGDDASTSASVRRILQSGRHPDVLVCDTDQSALAAIDTLRRYAVEVPRQMAVTGFDGILAGRLLSPNLTTVLQPMEEVGRRAVQILLDAVGDDDPLVTELLPAQFVRGGTCGCPEA